MITIDHHPRAVGAGQCCKLLDAVENPAAAEHHLADEDEVVGARLRFSEKTVGKVIERLSRDTSGRDPACFFPSSQLSACGVEFAVARQHPELAGAARRGGHEA